MSTVDYPHISLDSANVLVITGTTMKLSELVAWHLAAGWNANDLHREFPYLSLGQIYSGLAYYYDHREEVDRDIDDRRRNADELRPQLEDRTLVERLRKLKGQRSKS